MSKHIGPLKRKGFLRPSCKCSLSWQRRNCEADEIVEEWAVVAK